MAAYGKMISLWGQWKSRLPWLGCWPVVALGLAACAAPGPGEFDPDSRVYPPPVGTRVVVLRDITVPSGKARVTLQKGAVSERGVHPFDFWCQFEVNDVVPQAQTITAGDFSVRKVTYEYSSVVLSGQNSVIAQAGQGAINGPSDITRIRHMWLQSDSQPNVRRLSCGGAFDRAVDARFPSLNEMRQALGEWVRIEVPAAG